MSRADSDGTDGYAKCLILHDYLDQPGPKSTAFPSIWGLAFKFESRILDLDVRFRWNDKMEISTRISNFCLRKSRPGLGQRIRLGLLTLQKIANLKLEY
jgi:hypothetical protein